MLHERQIVGIVVRPGVHFGEDVIDELLFDARAIVPGGAFDRLPKLALRQDRGQVAASVDRFRQSWKARAIPQIVGSHGENDE